MRPRVWAPAVASVELDVDGTRWPMYEVGRGWREATVDLPPGADYGFVLDGDGPLPDPRSAWQPAGIAGPSRVVDHAGFEWHDAGWTGIDLEGAVLYELHVGTFTPGGTFDAAVERLDHLVDLGVDAVELMPVAEFPGDRGWGYDGVDIYAPHHAYGGPDGLKRLVDACHRRGLAVVLDVVYNHLGPAGNHLARFGPYFTDRYRTPWGAAVNLDEPGSDEVRAFFVDNALSWLRDHHVDGLRLDATHAMLDTSVRHFLEQLADQVGALADALGRRLFVIAESDRNDPRLVRPQPGGGYGLDAVWSDDFHHALHAALTGERSGYYADFGSLRDVARALTRGFVYDGRYSRFRDRVHGRPLGDVPGWRLLGYLQNHDQVGNRATGERSAQLLSTGLLEVAAAVVLTAPFTPLLFHGEEWGASTPFQYFTDHHDPELARAVSEGRRREYASFGWSPDDVPDPQDPATFERSKLRWDELTAPPHDRLLAWHRSLLALRRAHADLGPGDVRDVDVRYEAGARWLVVERGACAVVANLAAEPRTVPLPGSYARVLAASRPGRLDPDVAHLEPESVIILGP